MSYITRDLGITICMHKGILPPSGGLQNMS